MPKQITLPSAPAKLSVHPPEPSADYAVTVKIRNGRLLRAIRQAGYATPAAFARAHGINYQQLQTLITMTQSPFWASGKPKRFALDIADILGSNIEDILPPQFTGKSLATHAEVPSLTEDQVAMLIQNIPKTPEELAMLGEVGPAIDIALKTLSPRVERVLRLRFALGPQNDEVTLDDLAKAYNVSRERIRQIETKGLRRLKNPSRARELRDAAEIVGYPPPSRKMLGQRHVPPLANRLELEAQADERRKQQKLEREEAAKARARDKEEAAKELAEVRAAERRRQAGHSMPLVRLVRFPGEGSTGGTSYVSRETIREMTNAPPPPQNQMIGTPGVDRWVDLRGMLYRDPNEAAAAVIFFHEFGVLWASGDRTRLPPGSYIVPQWAVEGAPANLMELVYVGAQQDMTRGQP